MDFGRCRFGVVIKPGNPFFLRFIPAGREYFVDRHTAFAMTEVS
jgi:hypothetical protein